MPHEHEDNPLQTKEGHGTHPSSPERQPYSHLDFEPTAFKTAKQLLLFKPPTSEQQLKVKIALPAFFEKRDASCWGITRRHLPHPQNVFNNQWGYFDLSCLCLCVSVYVFLLAYRHYYTGGCVGTCHSKSVGGTLINFSVWLQNIHLKIRSRIFLRVSSGSLIYLQQSSLTSQKLQHLLIWILWLSLLLLFPLLVF